jgi:hypothetical protein
MRAEPDVKRSREMSTESETCARPTTGGRQHAPRRARMHLAPVLWVLACLGLYAAQLVRIAGV